LFRTFHLFIISSSSDTISKYWSDILSFLALDLPSPYYLALSDSHFFPFFSLVLIYPSSLCLGDSPFREYNSRLVSSICLVVSGCWRRSRDWLHKYSRLCLMDVIRYHPFSIRSCESPIWIQIQCKIAV
jgi:hypothetical protein